MFIFISSNDLSLLRYIDTEQLRPTLSTNPKPQTFLLDSMAVLRDLDTKL